MNQQHRPEHRFPDFLGIGANRGGSSWLYRVLAHHPEVWLPPVKEIHFFDRPAVGRRIAKYFGKEGAVRVRDYLTGDAFRTSGDGLLRNLAWDFHYLLRPQSDQWYIDLFRPHHGQITGEVTPAYAILDQAEVCRIAAANPSLKALFLLRNPIERGWSSLVNNLAKKQRRNIRAASFDEMRRRIDARGFQLRSDYARTITIWREVFGPDRLFIGYMEQIKSEPHTLLQQVCDFLAIDPVAPAAAAQLGAGVNTTRKYSAPMPPQLRRYMAESLLDSIERTHRLLDNRYSAAWLADARGALKST